MLCFGKDDRSTGIMSRPMLLVCLLLILIITSQFEWRQQLVSDMDTNPAESQKQQQISKREEGVKEKVIVASSNPHALVRNMKGTTPDLSKGANAAPT
ncbi:hypothetical protein SASPL_104352 [Salvia splendens]|uniref:Uncharacterized protein n=1 Tax=Salvia splendens TaxID=180675 RepID=A0A8X8YH20_SALSN|nr:hypothetical protein SASPL_104352 [Salvia splendens]